MRPSRGICHGPSHDALSTAGHERYAGNLGAGKADGLSHHRLERWCSGLRECCASAGSFCRRNGRQGCSQCSRRLHHPASRSKAHGRCASGIVAKLHEQGYQFISCSKALELIDHPIYLAANPVIAKDPVATRTRGGRTNVQRLNLKPKNRWHSG